MYCAPLITHTPTDVKTHLSNKASAFPATTDIIIIGGGIMGSSAAYYLSKTGAKIVLLEAGEISTGQSGRNWGFVRTLCRDPKEVPLAAEALNIWGNIDQEFGYATGWRQKGCLFLSSDEHEHQFYQNWQNEVLEIFADNVLLSREQLIQLFPHICGKHMGGIYTPNDGQAEPLLATTAFARAAQDNGVNVQQNCAALRILVETGKAIGVETTLGRISAPHIIVTLGAKLHQFLSPLGIHLPQKIVRSTVALTTPTTDLNMPCFVGNGLGMRQRPDGSLILATDGGTDVDLTLDSFRAMKFYFKEYWSRRRSFSLKFGKPFFDDLMDRISGSADNRRAKSNATNPAPNMDRSHKALEKFAQIFPHVAKPEIVKSWAGYIDVMPDALPVIDQLKSIKGITIAGGFSGHGFGLGPAVGKHLAAMAQGEQPSEHLKSFAYNRFEKGNFHRPYGGI